MECKEFKELIIPYLEEKLTESQIGEFESHEESCSKCKKLLDNEMAGMNGLEELVPQWELNPESWQRVKDNVFKKPKILKLSFPRVIKYAVAASFLIGFITLFSNFYKTGNNFDNNYIVAQKEIIITLSEKTKINIFRGSEYNITYDSTQKRCTFALRKGEVFFGIEKGAFNAFKVELSSGAVLVTGTFFSVKTISVDNFLVELLYGSLNISVGEKITSLEQGKSAEIAGGELVVADLSGHEKSFLKNIYIKLFGEKVKIFKERVSASVKDRKELKKRPANKQNGIADISGSQKETNEPEEEKKPLTFYEKLRNYKAVEDTSQLYADITSGEYFEKQASAIRNEPKDMDSSEEEWSMPVAKPWSVKEGIEIWHSDINMPVNWYEELDDMEFKYGSSGYALEKMAVLKAKRMKADGFIILKAGKMNRKVKTEIEFRKGKKQDLNMENMNLRNFGIYESDNYATRKNVLQRAFFLKVKFFKYY